MNILQYWRTVNMFTGPQMGMLYYNNDTLDIVSSFPSAKLAGHHCNGERKEIDQLIGKKRKKSSKYVFNLIFIV